MSDPLELWGRPRFAGDLLTQTFEAQIRARIRHEYLSLAGARRKVSGLQVRRRLAQVRFTGAVTIAPAAVMTMADATGPGGRLMARHVSITGDPASLDFPPVLDMPPRLPVAVIDGDRLIVTVLYDSADRAFVPLLARAELDVIETILAIQREVMARFNARLPEVVRRLVARDWGKLVAERAAR